MHVALAIVTLSNTTFGLSVDWLERRKRRGALLPAQVSRADVVRHLEDVVLATPPAIIATLGDREHATDHATDQSAMRAATRFLRRNRLCEMVSQANTEQGKPVSSRVLLEV